MTPETATLDPPFRRDFGRLLLGSINTDFCNQILICNIFRDLQGLHSFAPFFSEVEPYWKTHLEDLPNAAAFAAKAAEKIRAAEKWQMRHTRQT